MNVNKPIAKGGGNYPDTREIKKEIMEIKMNTNQLNYLLELIKCDETETIFIISDDNITRQEIKDLKYNLLMNREMNVLYGTSVK